MKTCPNCGYEMLNDNFVECPNCKFNLYSYEKKNNPLLSNINKKLPKSIGDIGEQISTQVKKEESFIKNRLNDESTALVDENEFFISKTVFDGIDYITNKKQEFEKKNTSKNQNKNNTTENVDGDINQDNKTDESKNETEKEIVDENVVKEKTVNTSTKSTQNDKKIYKKTKTQGKKRGLFSKKSPELKNFEKELFYYLGESFINTDYYDKRVNELNGFQAPSGNVKTILVDEFENGNLSMDDLENRIDELISLDNLSLIKYMLDEGYDTSVIKTQDDLYEFLKEKCDDLTADKSNLKIKLHKLGIWGFGRNSNIEDILMKELEENNLSLDDVETRVEELKKLDVGAMNTFVLYNKHDTSVIKTQEDLYEFLKDKYGIQLAENSNKKVYRKKRLFEKYNIDPNEAYCFECTIEERRTSTFSNTNRRDVDKAYVALYDDSIVIIKESAWLKSDMGMRKVYFKNVTSIDYDTAGKLGMSSSLFIHMHSGEHVQLKFITKERVDEIQNRFEKYINEKNNKADNVQINQETSHADELLKYAELFEKDLITKEEFEKKKKELL